jgi:hypothetical protein
MTYTPHELAQLLRDNPQLRVDDQRLLHNDQRLALAVSQPLPKLSEHELQAAVIGECDRRALTDPRWRFCFHCPNGGDRDVRVAAKLKTEGVRSGVPDLLWLLPACGFYGLAMELKIGKNKCSPAQSEWLQWLSDRNFFTCVVYDDPGEAIGILSRYLEGA